MLANRALACRLESRACAPGSARAARARYPAAVMGFTFGIRCRIPARGSECGSWRPLAAAGINSGGLISRAGANAGAGRENFETEADYMSLFLLSARRLISMQRRTFCGELGAGHPSSQL